MVRSRRLPDAFPRLYFCHRVTLPTIIPLRLHQRSSPSVLPSFLYHITNLFLLVLYHLLSPSSLPSREALTTLPPCFSLNSLGGFLTMSALLPTVAASARRGLARAAAGGPRAAPGGTRSMASHAEPEVTWAQYRSNDATFQEWVEANRHIVSLVCLGTFGGLIGLSMRGGKKEDKADPSAAEAAPTAVVVEKK